MAYYPDDMTFEEMMNEFARLFALMILTSDDPDESSESVLTEEKTQKSKKRISKTKNLNIENGKQ